MYGCVLYPVREVAVYHWYVFMLVLLVPPLCCHPGTSVGGKWLTGVTYW